MSESSSGNDLDEVYERNAALVTGFGRYRRQLTSFVFRVPILIAFKPTTGRATSDAAYAVRFSVAV